jgi:hypothetical protein
MSKRYTKHKICRKTLNMAQKTAKRHYISAILSAIGQPQRLVWHIPLYKKAQKKCPKYIGH